MSKSSAMKNITTKKKVFCMIVLLTVANVLHAQGLLNKLKNKLNNNAGSPATNAGATNVGAVGQASASGQKYNDPSQFGTVVYTFSKSEMDAHSGSDGYGFNMWFSSIKVVNNQLELQVADHDAALYNYANGHLQKTGGKPDLSRQNKMPTGNERDLWSVDFSQTDQANAMLKKGPHVASGMLPGKSEQTYTFNGKAIGNFFMAMVAHNADSSVVTVVGASITGGMSYKMVSSNGQQLALPKKYGGTALISPDGKVNAALYMGSTGFDVYLSNGTKFSIGNFNNGQAWLRNSGSVFNVEISNPNALDKNGTLYHTFEMPVNAKTLFISSDDKSMCWEGPHGLYFSDGTAIENGQSPQKVILDNKEVIVFLATDTGAGKLYLCRHNL
jgi:hypothetical protein